MGRMRKRKVIGGEKKRTRAGREEAYVGSVSSVCLGVGCWPGQLAGLHQAGEDGRGRGRGARSGANKSAGEARVTLE